MKALITGISGFVGSYLTEYLLDNTDWQVAGTVYGPYGNIKNLCGTLELYPAELSRLDVVSFILEQSHPDYIFHLAAQPLPSLSRRDPWGTLETNIRMQLNILQAVVDLKMDHCRILVVGSSEEYGLVHPDELPIKETNPFRPLSPYAVSKVGQDLLGLQYYLNYGVQAIRVRPFNHIGPRQRPGFVAPDFAQQIAEAEAGLRETVVRVGNLNVKRDFTDVRDVVRAYHLAITLGQPGEVYNIGSEQAHSIQELLDTFLAMSTVPITVEQDPARARASDLPLVVADCSKFRAQTGWQPTIPFQDTLRDVLDYWREQVAGG
ncbi:MAG: GDP-mannose 4,6-dehydratase [Anaerolineae bacterium]|jgi:GDP-4-dehydro-6-deoxy-D-mannose reductase|nr:GDP-mannose 4,6-dehydratase [Anaerolineae bacterium]MDH7474131.1 GDP-mannose 4,6-dehydratase [Anaerolineae bacterium]